ncbi:MAG: hypothetical protein DDT28_01225 [Dehalococcoidia bacterium]|nr:hypothetical protein [Chloroflexota bacterium]
MLCQGGYGRTGNVVHLFYLKAARLGGGEGKLPSSLRKDPQRYLVPGGRAMGVGWVPGPSATEPFGIREVHVGVGLDYQRILRDNLHAAEVCHEARVGRHCRWVEDGAIFLRPVES